MFISFLLTLKAFAALAMYHIICLSEYLGLIMDVFSSVPRILFGSPCDSTYLPLKVVSTTNGGLFLPFLRTLTPRRSLLHTSICWMQNN